MRPATLTTWQQPTFYFGILSELCSQPENFSYCFYLRRWWRWLANIFLFVEKNVTQKYFNSKFLESNLLNKSIKKSIDRRYIQTINKKVVLMEVMILMMMMQGVHLSQYLRDNTPVITHSDWLDHRTVSKLSIILHMWKYNFNLSLRPV